MEHDAFVERGLDWDRRERGLIEAWEAKKKELDEKYPDQRGQIGTSTVEEWNPNAPKGHDPSQEGSSLTVLSTEEAEHKAAILAIDKLEQ